VKSNIWGNGNGNGQIKPNQSKVKAITNAPEPRDLYELQKKGRDFVCSDTERRCFEKSKTLLLQHGVLELFDPNKPITLSCDSSSYGVGAVLAHTSSKPVIFASSTLSQAERNYSNLHREALAIIFVLKKFHKYLYGHKFTIFSDHSPLQENFNPNKNTPPVACARPQRWEVILSGYDYKIQYKRPSEIACADALSRLPLGEPTNIENLQINFFAEDWVQARELKFWMNMLC
jgi:RNase H-like domain found in reverse transcriptase